MEGFERCAAVALYLLHLKERKHFPPGKDGALGVPVGGVCVRELAPLFPPLLG